jgi:hypothetical protein
MLIPFWVKPVAALAVLGAALLFAYNKGSSDKAEEHTQANQKRQLAEQAQQLEDYKLLVEVMEAQANAQSKAAAERDAANQATAGKLASTIEWLRNRPDRPPTGAVPEAPGDTKPGATGAELYRPDATFLIGEAARADRQQDALKECYANLDAAQASWLAFQQPKK